MTESRTLNDVAAALGDRYRVERELGAGGMATVYLAEDSKHHRQVAIKVLRAEVAAGVGAERFVREIRTAAQLAHPHVLPLFDSGEADGFVYYVMPFVKGESLRERLCREHELPVEEAVRIATQVAAALDHAHRRGVIHRDIKPENILLQEGEALLADFGIARAISEASDDRLTEAGLAVGTAAYMSPEQALGEPAVDARTDVYSLGCVLYEMLAGEPPFTGATAKAVLAKRLVDPVPSVRRLRESVPQHLDAVIHRALARTPADRFGGASDFAEALTAPAAAHARQSIAVLPFTNLSPDPENEYFSDGITEDIITRLSKVSSMKVISRTSVMRFKGTTKGIREIADTLGVATVLEGSVRRAGHRLRVNAQLIDAQSDEHLWAEAYDRRLADVFDVQAELAEAIVTALHARFPATEGTRAHRRPAIDVETYNLCLLGRHHWHRWTESDFQRSIEFFERALRREPDCALAHAGLGLAYGTLALGYWSVRGTDFYPRAKRSLERALELDPELAEAHVWLGVYEAQHEYAWSAAVTRVKRGLTLNTNSPMAHDALHLLLLATGRHDEASRESARAVELDPLSYFHTGNAAMRAYRSRDYEDAIASFQSEIALDPNLPMGHALLSLPLIQVGRCEEAVATIEHALRMGYPPTEPFLALALATVGRREDAQAVLGRVEARRATEHAWPFALAMAYAGLGDTDTAFARLREAQEERDFWMIWLAVEPALDPLRADPRFHALLHQVNLVDAGGLTAPS